MSEDSTIREWLKGHIFAIPDYQRAYSWETQQLKQFVDDLYDAQDKYYLGHFLFEKANDTLMIIDGQQRITTCMIFYRAVVNFLEEMNANGKYQKEIKIFSSRLYDKDEGIPRLQTVDYDNATGKITVKKDGKLDYYNADCYVPLFYIGCYKKSA